MRFSWKSWKSSRYAAVALGASLVMASAAAASAPADATTSGGQPMILGLNPLTGRVTESPSSQLFGIFCTSPADCWAVGETSSNLGERNQVLHWTGRHWFKVAVPNPAGTHANDQNELFAVRCTSASNCLAVGQTKKPNKAVLDQALRWNGRKWSAVTTPTPGGILADDLNTLDDVTCTSASSCWAAGDYGAIMSTMTGESEVLLNQVLHWNGRSWSLVSVPNPAGDAPDKINALAGVRCASPTDCWASGASGTFGIDGKATVLNEMLHWNGKKWFKQTVPSPGGTTQGAINELNSLVCASPANCWAAGFAGVLTGTLSTSTLLNQILHWNGKKWFAQKVPNPGGGGAESEDVLLGITCPLPRNCWAVGSAGKLPAGTATLNEILHWNGTKWTSFKAPNPGGTGSDASNILNQVRCTSATNCWAVGESEKPSATDQDQKLHWTGRKWFVG